MPDDDWCVLDWLSVRKLMSEVHLVNVVASEEFTLIKRCLSQVELKLVRVPDPLENHPPPIPVMYCTTARSVRCSSHVCSICAQGRRVASGVLLLELGCTC